MIYKLFCPRYTPDKNIWCTDYVKRRAALHRAEQDGNVALLLPAPANPPPNKALNWLYEVLNVLDSKASALMRLNGVMLAAAAFLISPTYVSRVPDLSWWTGASSGMLSALSILSCMVVVAVDWPFLGKAAGEAREDEEYYDFSPEFFYLQKVCVFRETLYRYAWRVSFTATLLLIVALITFIFA